MDLKEITALLEKYPDIKTRLGELLRIVEGGGTGEVLLADDAEGRTIEAIRGMGQDILQNWAEQRSNQASMQLKKQVKSAKKNIKKKSTG